MMKHSCLLRLSASHSGIILRNLVYGGPLGRMEYLKVGPDGNRIGLMGRKGIQPQRTCIVCRGKRAKGELLRLTLDDNGKVYWDQRQLHHGRGAYVCPRPECLTGVKLAHLNRAFRRTLSADSWNRAIVMVAALKGCDVHL